MMTATSSAERVCPLCESGSASVVAHNARIDEDALDEFAFASRKVPEYMHHRLLRCTGCDVLYASPTPDPQDLLSAYDTAGFDAGAESRYAARTYARLLDGFLHRLPDRDGALDIGTGDGSFLRELLDRGFTRVMGVEASRAPVEAATDAVRPLIVNEAFRPGLSDPGSLTLVTCFQTIEHLFEPLAVCVEALRLLRPGGALLLVGHNRGALSARVLGRRSPIYDIEHVQLFSPRSARLLLERAGCVDVTVRPIVNTYPLSYWARLAPIPRRTKVAATTWLRHVRLALPLPAGNLAMYGFRAREHQVRN